MREEIENYFISMLNKVEGGDMNPLDLKIEIKAILTLLEGIDKQIAPIVALEGQKWHNQTYNGFRIEYMDSGGRYSYDHIEEYVRLKNRMKHLEKLSQFAYKNGGTEFGKAFVIDDDGVEIPAAKWRGTEAYIKLIKIKEGD